ncbi:MAG: uroporphyrinogen decarboxylase family protein [Armatimonadota bacterium]
MRFTLDIEYAPEKMEASRKRMEARRQYTYVDRVPVGFCLEPRYFCPVFGIKYCDFFTDVETHYNWQLQFIKYRIEQIPEDMICVGPTLAFAPYFDNVVDSDALGAQTFWPENETLQVVPTIHTVEQMERFQIPAPDAGMWGMVRDWWLAMRDLVADTRLTFNGQEGKAEMGILSVGHLSPFMLAVDLVGVDFYWWLLEYPEACHTFIGKIADAVLQADAYYRTIDPRVRGTYELAEDSAQILSVESFREFCVPYDRRFYDVLGGYTKFGRGMHMCGTSAHLYPALVEDLQITSFDLMGFPVAPQIIAEKLGGKALLWGNINPMLMLHGSKAEVKAECTAALQAMAPCGGLLLGDGANVCPGTPLENLAALTEAAEDYGLPQVTTHQ